VTGIQHTGRFLLRLSWSGLLLWQIIWHAMLPVLPAGNRNWTLAIIALIPLLPLTPGVIKARHRSLVLGMFLVMVYFIIGVMETWSNADQRIAAIVQIVMTCMYFTGLVMFNRPVQGPPD
jgi:uncharacterized membrane protein